MERTVQHIIILMKTSDKGNSIMKNDPHEMYLGICSKEDHHPLSFSSLLPNNNQIQL